MAGNCLTPYRSKHFREKLLQFPQILAKRESFTKFNDYLNNDDRISMLKYFNAENCGPPLPTLLVR